MLAFSLSTNKEKRWSTRRVVVWWQLRNGASPATLWRRLVWFFKKSQLTSFELNLLIAIIFFASRLITKAHIASRGFWGAFDMPELYSSLCFIHISIPTFSIHSGFLFFAILFTTEISAFNLCDSESSLSLSTDPICSHLTLSMTETKFLTFLWFSCRS